MPGPKETGIIAGTTVGGFAVLTASALALNEVLRRRRANSAAFDASNLAELGKSVARRVSADQVIADPNATADSALVVTGKRSALSDPSAPFQAIQGPLQGYEVTFDDAAPLVDSAARGAGGTTGLADSNIVDLAQTLAPRASASSVHGADEATAFPAADVADPIKGYALSLPLRIIQEPLQESKGELVVDSAANDGATTPLSNMSGVSGVSEIAYISGQNEPYYEPETDTSNAPLPGGDEDIRSKTVRLAVGHAAVVALASAERGATNIEPLARMALANFQDGRLGVALRYAVYAIKLGRGDEFLTAADVNTNEALNPINLKVKETNLDDIPQREVLEQKLNARLSKVGQQEGGSSNVLVDFSLVPVERILNSARDILNSRISSENIQGVSATTEVPRESGDPAIESARRVSDSSINLLHDYINDISNSAQAIEKLLQSLNKPLDKGVVATMLDPLFEEGEEEELVESRGQSSQRLVEPTRQVLDNTKVAARGGIERD